MDGTVVACGGIPLNRDLIFVFRPRTARARAADALRAKPPIRAAAGTAGISETCGLRLRVGVERYPQLRITLFRYPVNAAIHQHTASCLAVTSERVIAFHGASGRP